MRRRPGRDGPSMPRPARSPALSQNPQKERARLRRTLAYSPAPQCAPWTRGRGPDQRVQDRVVNRLGYAAEKVPRLGRGHAYECSTAVGSGIPFSACPLEIARKAGAAMDKVT